MLTFKLGWLPTVRSRRAISSKVAAFRGTYASLRTRATHIVVWTSLEAVLDAVGQDYVIVWRQKAVPRVAAARGLSGRHRDDPQ
jgi:hypothetical protein